MKKLLASVAVITALMAPPAHAQSAGAFVLDSYEAQANWVGGRSAQGSPVFRVVAVSRYSKSAGATDTFAQIGRVSCESRTGQRSFLYSCDISGHLIFLKQREFQFDGALRYATVAFEAFGQMNSVEWMGRGKQPQPDWSLYGGERALIAGASLTAGANAKGSVRGQTFSTKHKKTRASLRRGTEVSLLYETGAEGFTVRGSSREVAWRNLRRKIDSL